MVKLPNRVAALGGTAASIVAVLLAVLGAVDSIAKAIVVAVAIVVLGLIVVVFLIGSQRSEALGAQPRSVPGVAAHTLTVDASSDDGEDLDAPGDDAPTDADPPSDDTFRHRGLRG